MLGSSIMLGAKMKEEEQEDWLRLELQPLAEILECQICRGILHGEIPKENSNRVDIKSTDMLC